MKKIFAFILAVLICFSLIACNSGDGNTSTTPAVTTLADSGTNDPADTAPDNNAEENIMTLIADGKSEFKIIRPDGCSDYVIFSMNVLRNAIIDKFLVRMSVGFDWIKNLPAGAEYESPAPEILIGETNRIESREAYASLAEGEYIIKAIGNKLVILGYNDYLTHCAVNEFVEKYVNSATDGTIKLSLPFEKKGVSDKVTVGETDAIIRAMTFNVLASGSKPDERIPYILNAIKTYDPSIIGFQECNQNQHNKMVENLEGYSLALKYHANGKTFIHTPIVYKTEMFDLIDAGVEWLDMRYTKTSTKSLAYAVLKDKQTGTVFAVLNVHGSLWISNYELPEGKTEEDMVQEAKNVWKLDNMRQMNDLMKKLTEKHGDIPVIWMGDFNFTETHSAYEKVTKEYGMSDAEKVATVSHESGIKTSHDVGVVPITGKSIDHVFGNSKIVFRVQDVCSSPDDLKASDHCPVYADFLFK